MNRSAREVLIFLLALALPDARMIAAGPGDCLSV